MEQKNIFPATKKTLLDPRTKLFLMIIVSSIAMIGSIEGMQIYPRLLILLLPCGLLFINKQWKKALFFTFLFFAAWFGESNFTNFSMPTLNMIILMICGVITRFGPALLMGSFLFFSTETDELITGLNKMKFPNQITIPFASMFRFFPTIREEAKYIKDAMMMRGIQKTAIVKMPIKFLEYCLVPLLNSMIKISTELAISSMTRGLGHSKSRTSIIKLKMSLFDWYFVSLGSLLGLCYFVL